MAATLEVRRLQPADLDLLCAAPEGIFEDPVDRQQAAAFLADPGHEIVMAFLDGAAVGIATGTVIRHPDKRPTLFINEVGVLEAHQRQGIATLIVQCLLDVARAGGCDGAWLGTEADNAAARGLYEKLGAQASDGIVIYDWDEMMNAG